MSDFAQVILVGNLQHDIRTQTDPETGMVCGRSILCVGQTRLVQGEPVNRTLSIPIEIHGQSRVSVFRQQFGAGSRLLCQGTFMQGDSATNGALRVVVETVFMDDMDRGSPEARQDRPSRSGRAAAVGTSDRPRAAAVPPDDEAPDEREEYWRSVWN